MNPIFQLSLKKLWNKWEIHILVLLSLSLQSILILISNRRKYTAGKRLELAIWLAYLSADWVATVSLGVLAKYSIECGEDSLDMNYTLLALWAPFLLLHLGGPDNITAYSLEDNELWLRHLLGLVVQVGLAVYVFIRSWTSTTLNFLAIPMFIAGIIKYGERTWALRYASSNNFRESMLSKPDPGPNYARYMEEYKSQKDEGFGVRSESVIVDLTAHYSYKAVRSDIFPKAAILQAAYNFFSTFKRLFADLILSFHDIKNSQSFFQIQNRSHAEAFEVIEIELGFIYDLFYTKATLIYSLVGGILRCITISSTISVFVAFLIIDKHGYSEVDVIITYSLQVGAICLEIYSIIILLSSNRTMLCFSTLKNMLVDFYFRAILSIPSTKGWSDSMAQYNLIRFCLNERPPRCRAFQKVLGIYQWLEKQRYKDSKDVSSDLKELIFKQLVKKSRSASNFRDCRKLCAQRGKWVLENETGASKLYCLDKFGWSIEVDFDQSILLWHIATDLCYNSDTDSDSVDNRNREASKLLSDYMLYLLVVCPFMLPNGIGQIRFRDTCAETIEFFEERKSIKDAERACTMLLKVSVEVPPSEVKGDRSKSVLFDACRLAKSLQSLDNAQTQEQSQEQSQGQSQEQSQEQSQGQSQEQSQGQSQEQSQGQSQEQSQGQSQEQSQGQRNVVKKWDLIIHMWVEILSYAASQCRWNHHAQQLRQGGELLTHVWLLMAHLGLTEQFQISVGHARAKLSKK